MARLRRQRDGGGVVNVRLAFVAVVVAACSADRSPASDSAAAPARDTAAATADPVLGLRSFGPLRYGATGGHALPSFSRVPLDSACHYAVARTTGADSVAAMVVFDTIVRVDVRTAGTRTTSGDRVGDREADVLARHAGRVSVEPHKYVPSGHDLVVRDPADSTFQLVFETDGTKVTSMRAGRLPYVRWVEGCA